jgi:predicted nucleic acid-binding protein
VIVVDSSVWIDYFNGTDTPAAGRLDALLGIEPVVVGDLILTEVLQGFRREAHYRTARELLTRLPMIEMVGKHIALRSAENFRALRARGITVRRTVDVLIATCCVENELPLLFSDRVFLPFVRTLGLKAA